MEKSYWTSPYFLAFITSRNDLEILKISGSHSTQLLEECQSPLSRLRGQIFDAAGEPVPGSGNDHTHLSSVTGFTGPRLEQATWYLPKKQSTI